MISSCNYPIILAMDIFPLMKIIMYLIVVAAMAVTISCISVS